jgi:hypothetical protein
MTNARLTNNNNNYYYCNNHNVIDRFFRWLSERYPKINQRMTLTASDELSQAYYQRNPPAPLDPPDPLSTCGLPPPIDRLYIDMNGILHGCSHNNMDELGTSTLSEDDIFKNVCFYLERIVGEMVEPTTLVYMAIDGVAPRINSGLGDIGAVMVERSNRQSLKRTSNRNCTSKARHKSFESVTTP